MQMYLFADWPRRLHVPRHQRRRRRGDRLPRVHARPLQPAGHDADGSGALSSPHAGAMGEAWSDWYALDLLAATASRSTTRHAGRGRHRRATRTPLPHATARPGRSTARSTPPTRRARAASTPAPAASPTATSARWPAAPRCTPTARSGRRRCGTCARADVATGRGRRVGHRRALVTDGMRLSPPEPSFLDMRNAILAADAPLRRRTTRPDLGGLRAPRHGLLRRRRRRRRRRAGRGLHAAAGPGAARASIAGTVTDADTGPAARRRRRRPRRPDHRPGVPGLRRPTTTEANGTTRWRRPGRDVPSWPVFGSRGLRPGHGALAPGDPRAERRMQNVTLRRDWAAAPRRRGRDGGVPTTPAAPFGCGVDQVIDQSQGVGLVPRSTRPARTRRTLRRRLADGGDPAVADRRHPPRSGSTR